MSKKIKITLFVFLFAVLWLPFLQEKTQFFKELDLGGAFFEPSKPEFSIASFDKLDYQKQFEDYQNYKFGFRAIFIKIRNSINYILFKELSIPDNIAGKNNFVFSVGSTERTLGIRYNGKEKTFKTIEKINFLKEKLENEGKHLIVLVVPSKETILPDFLPSIYKGKQKNQTDYNDFIDVYKK